MPWARAPRSGGPRVAVGSGHSTHPPVECSDPGHAEAVGKWALDSPPSSAHFATGSVGVSAAALWRAGGGDLATVAPEDVGQPDDEDDGDERDAQRPGQVEQGRHDECAERRAHRRRQPGPAASPPRVEGAGRGTPPDAWSRCSAASCSSCDCSRLPRRHGPLLVEADPRSARSGRGRHGHRPRTQFSSRCSPASPDFSGWNWVAAQGPILDRGDELRTVTRPRDPGRDPGEGAGGLERPLLHGIRVDEVEALVLDAARRAREPAATSTSDQPMWGTTAAGRRSTVPGHSPSPSSGCSDGSVEPSKSTCMPTQTPSTGRPPLRRRPMMRGPCAAARPAMQAWKLPTPGTKSPSHSSAAAGSASASPSRRRARGHARPSGRCRCRSRGRRRRHSSRRLHRQSAPLALGMPTTRGSRAMAARSARATALNCASTMWWGSRPASTRTCRQSPAL